MMKKYMFIILLGITSCTETELEQLSLTEDLVSTTLIIDHNSCEFEYGLDLDNNPKGGGNGYRSIIAEQDADYVVSSLNDLKSAVKDAQDNDVIFINGIIEFADSTDTLNITKSITLASNRGANGCGALLKTSLFGTYDRSISGWTNNSKPSSLPIIVVSNTKEVRITGLRFEGPEPGEGDENSNIKELKYGIQINNSNDILIDNCEIYNWSHTGVSLGENTSNNIVIKNNYFHNNRYNNYGYGIGLFENAFALVKNNVFNENRHDISNEGKLGSGYEFSYNILGNSTHGNIDTHGKKDFDSEGADSSQPADIAGSFFYVHHNEFRSSDGIAILIRGVPEKIFMIEKNKFAHNHIANVIQHFIGQDSYDKHVFGFNNSYNGNYQGFFVSRDYKINQKIIKIPQNQSFIERTNPDGNPFEIMDFAIGNFTDNPLVNDIFVNDNGWKAIEYPEPETMHWKTNRMDFNWTDDNDLAGSSILPSNLKIGDFNGDGKSDVFKANGSNWAISYGGMTGWQVINTSDLVLSELKFGDFNGNETTDVFWANGTDWFLSDGANSNWLDINTSGFDNTKLKTGDFNEDGKMDIFTASSGQWKYASGGSGNWINLGSSSISLQNLILLDINNNGRTDVVRKYSNSHKVSLNGNSSWTLLNTNEFSDLFEKW